MPFDSAGFPQPPPRRPSGPSDTAVTVLIAVVAAVLMVTPISLGVVADIVRYLRGH